MKPTELDSMNRLRVEAAREVARLKEALESIRRYGLDTLSGRTDGPDDRDWQRAAVNEMTKRARLALAGTAGVKVGGELKHEDATAYIVIHELGVVSTIYTGPAAYTLPPGRHPLVAAGVQGTAVAEYKPCPDCSGSGIADNTEHFDDCKPCKGTGNVGVEWADKPRPHTWCAHCLGVQPEICANNPAAHGVREDAPSADAEVGEGPLRDGWQVSIGPGHAGYGCYAHMTEYPEEGAVCLATFDPSEYPDAADGVTGGGLTQQLARAVDANEAGHDPLCMAILRGKECTCGLDERTRGVAVLGEAQLYVTCHQCDNCQHIGINDEHPTESACNRGACGWHGPSPIEDLCPGCGETGTMSTACPKCGGHYVLLAEARLPQDGAPESETGHSEWHDLNSAADAVERVGRRGDWDEAYCAKLSTWLRQRAAHGVPVLRLEVGMTYRRRGGGEVLIDTKSQTTPPIFYGRLPDRRVVGWHEDGRCPPDQSGRTEYPDDLLTHGVTAAGHQKQSKHTPCRLCRQITETVRWECSGQCDKGENHG